MHVAVTAVGRDRPGIVAAVTKVLFEHGANIEDSRMAILGGHFSMMLIVASEIEPGRLEAALGEATHQLGLVVAVRPVADVAAGHGPGEPYAISVYGADHPGIVYRVSEVLANHSVNITDLATHVVEGDPPVYVMILEVTVPAALDASVLEADLKRLGSEVGVDVSLRPAEADTL